MKESLYYCVAIIVLSVILVGAQVFIIYQHIRKMSYDSKPFIRNNPAVRLRMLFIGDSTAVGTGARSNTQSVAGYFGHDYPAAQIDNNSYNGRKLHQMACQFPTKTKFQYDLVVAQIGANDIMQFTPFNSIT